MIEQVNWESLKTDLIPQAVIGEAPSFFHDTYGILFSEKYDGLGDYKGALFLFDHNTMFALK
jgi:hypothetical protein